MAAVGSPVVAGHSYTSRRTEAMPKASLFGSLLEIQDGDSKSVDVTKATVPKTPPVRGAGMKFVLPENVKKNLPGSIALENSKKVVTNQKGVVNTARDSLKQKEEEALYRTVQAGGGGQTDAPGTSKSQWFTEKDLQGAGNINIVGLNKNQSYNRDKYGRKPPTHNYSLIGDVLRPGMDLPRRERTEIQMRNQGFGMGDLKGALADGMKPPSPSRGNKSARTPRRPTESVELPPNIKHQFGSRICDNLLADKAKVEQTIKHQEDVKASIQRKSQRFDVPKFTKELNPEYEMLGNALRMNVAPGYTIDHKISTTKTAFNDQVHLFRNQDPDKWRYQKDELSRWSEHQFLHARMTKSWNDMLQNAPKFSRNWNPADFERTKTAPINATRQKKPAAKVKPKTAPSKKPEEPAFEDFVFETPPITPTPKTPEKIKPVQSRDNEFWDSYDKGTT